MDDISNSEGDSDYQLEYEFYEDGEDEGGERASDLDESEGLGEGGVRRWVTASDQNISDNTW